MTREMFLQSAVLVAPEKSEGEEVRARKQEERLILDLQMETTSPAHATCSPQYACLDAPDAVRYQNASAFPIRLAPLYPDISAPLSVHKPMGVSEIISDPSERRLRSRGDRVLRKV